MADLLFLSLLNYLMWTHYKRISRLYDHKNHIWSYRQKKKVDEDQRWYRDIFRPNDVAHILKCQSLIHEFIKLSLTKSRLNEILSTE